jgi:fructokinase
LAHWKSISSTITKKLKLSALNNIIGTGFLALDIIVNGSTNTPPKIQAGGSFGNVLTILSYLGFQTYPISRLADNKFTDLLLDDITYWNVNTSLIFKDEKASTPVIIHRILKNSRGEPIHRFEFRNPTTGKRLPSYRPFRSDKVNIIENMIPKSNVYYFDRANRGSIELAKIAKSRGAFVVFEPSGYGDPKHFKESIDISDIVKFSNQRLSNYRKLYPNSNAILEIETKGSQGLSYRFNSDNWIDLEPKIIHDVVDTAGAGDWCSAGIIKIISSNGPLQDQTHGQIEDALQMGQAFGAVNCLFDGARGAMYQLGPEEFMALTKQILDNDVKIIDNIGKKAISSAYTHNDLKELFELEL